jgi:hypothetical protein
MMAKKMQHAVGPGNRCALRYYWLRWNDLVLNERIEREVSMRSKHTWDKVKDWMKK